MTEAAILLELDRIWNDLAEQLDVPPSKYREAKDRYDAVGKWLDAQDSPLKPYRPEIYPQGSFALGTVVKPIGEEEYDVDAVCRLDRTPPNITQKRLKALVGDRLKQNGKYAQMLNPREGGRRCWTLQYAEEAKFHLDILPAIPDDLNWLLSLGVPHNLAKHAICITDKTSWDYDNDWPKSNPMGYVIWFKSRMQALLLEGRRVLALEKHTRIEDIQDYEVRTPLQRIIQILKRHRDIRYAEDDDKPISIIISTLAATVYQNESTLAKALFAVVPQMRNELIRQKRGNDWWVANPVNPAENFADKWGETKRKAEVFFEWLDVIEKEHRELLSESGFTKVGEYLTEAYGAREASKVIGKYANQSKSGQLAKYGGTTPLSESVRELISFDLPQRQQPSWPVLAHNPISLTAQWKKTGSWRLLTSNGAYVLRGSELRFKATTTIQPPYQVYWQVVNTGRDAHVAYDLRGDFTASTQDLTNPLVHDEKAKYRGRHWIECFIVKNGGCIGRSGEFIVNIA